MTIEQLANKLDEIIPTSLSEPWDNDGRMIMPNPDATVTGVVCALDCTSRVIDYAINEGMNVIITHHPLIFKPLSAIDFNDSVGKRVIKCIENKISVLSYHTRFDSMENGVNDILAETLGLENITPFIPYGRIGEVEEQSFDNFALSIADKLEIPKNQLNLVKAKETVKKVAVISGCGKDEIKEVIKAGADTFVTGEVMHNHMIDCKELGLNLICATHHATETIAVWKLFNICFQLGLDNCAILPFLRKEEYGI